MTKWYLFVVLLLCCVIFGCSPKQKNWTSMSWGVRAQYCLDSFPVGPETFVMTFKKKIPPRSIEGKLASCPLLVCEAQFKNLVPGKNYVLYCPNTGDPEYPECEILFTYTEKGELREVIDDTYHMYPVESIQGVIPAIPGFASDWYLEGLDKPFSVYHAVVRYKPIVAKSSDGKELRVEKKECGGNMLFVSLSGFLPNETISFTSDSSGEAMPITVTMDSQGKHSYYSFPQVVGKTKGVETISIACGKEMLRVSCDWDMSTLDVKRKQPYSITRKRMS